MHGEKLAVGIDIGGTNIKIGLSTTLGELVAFQSIPIERNADQSVDVTFICEAVKNFIEKHSDSYQLAGVGVASPGILDTDRGVVNYAVNLGWNDLRLVEVMESYLQLDVCLVSDAVAGALGEQYYSAAGMTNFLYICIGTGIGASYFNDGKFYKGDLGEAINIGHTSVMYNGVTCVCGNKGCLEKYVSASALAQRARSEVGEVQTLLSQYAHVPEELEAHHIYEAAKSGDTYAIKLFRKAGELLGTAIVNCIHLFGVQNVILGGGMSKAGSLLLEPVREEVAARYAIKKINILNAAMPSESGTIGAASLIFKGKKVGTR